MLPEKCKILVCYHKPSRLFDDPLYLPINAGRALIEQKYQQGILSLSEKKWLYQNTVGDDTGENISELNYSFCELTVIFWAWKNYEKLGSPDYIGLCHYRRIFDVDSLSLEKFLGDNDIVYAGCDESLARTCNDSIKTQFLQCHKDDLQKCLEYLKNNNVAFYNSLNEYLSLPFEKSALYNMFIFKKDIFFEYCELLFSVLFHVKEKINLSSYSQYGSRVFGFLAERLSGAFFYHKQKLGLNVKKSVPFFFDERFIKISLENIWAERSYVKTVIGGSNDYQSKSEGISIVMPLDGCNLDLSLLTVKTCIDNCSPDRKCHILLLSDADIKQSKVLIRKIKDKIECCYCIKKNFSVSLIILSESFIEKFKLFYTDFTDGDLEFLKVIKTTPSLWFLLLNSEICETDHVFWFNSGYLANDDFSNLAEKVDYAGIQKRLNAELRGCESLYCFIAENEQKSKSDIQIDFSLPVKYVQTNFLYIDLNWLRDYRLKITRNLVEFNGVYAINATDMDKCIGYYDYYWSVETNISKDYSATLSRRLSLGNYMKYSTYRNNWKGAFVAEGEFSILKYLGMI